MANPKKNADIGTAHLRELGFDPDAPAADRIAKLRELRGKSDATDLAISPALGEINDPAAGEFPPPVDVVGTDPSWVGRVRQSLDDPCTIELFICGDNLRKGAALNTAQIAELVAAEFGSR